MQCYFCSFIDHKFALVFDVEYSDSLNKHSNQCINYDSDYESKLNLDLVIFKHQNIFLQVGM